MPPPPEFAAAIGGHPLVAEVLWQRGYRSVEAAQAFLDPNYYSPASPHDLPDLDVAVERLTRAIAQGERIRIWGDFDVDGQTATSVLLLGLRACGVHADYTIPNRLTHSHGLNSEGIQQAKEDGIGVLITCDCGVTDFEHVSYARQLGLDVIISDHHDLEHDELGAPRLPAANAIVNPKRLPPKHPLMHLPGVGVAYELIVALTERIQSNAISPPPPSPSALLDLVALGIVADIAYQQTDTRYLLQRGLQQLRQSPRPGILALMRAAGISPQSFDTDAIGYQIGPRLNAAGRMETADLSVQLLTAADDAAAQPLAERIEQLNNERKKSQRLMEEQALAQLAERPELTRFAVIVLNSPEWSASVIGVVANGIVDRYNRPAILIAARPGEIGRASARSVPGIDIHAAIAAQEHLIEGGGGHPMAAGFAIRAENIDAFRQAVSEHVRQQMAANQNADVEAESASEASDLPAPENIFGVAWRDVTLELCDQIERLAPFGAGNLRPQLLSRALTFVRAEPIGQDGKHQLLYFQDQTGYQARAAWWRSVGRPMPTPSALVSLVFGIRRNLYQGRVRLQIEVMSVLGDSLREAAPNAASNAGETNATIASRFRILDCRGELDRAAALQRVLTQYGAAHVQVWAEGAAGAAGVASATNHSIPLGITSRTRRELQSASVLVIWTAPPGTAELQYALSVAQPQTVILLCAASHQGDTPEIFAQQVGGMLKSSRLAGDSTDDPEIVARMAARVGQRAETIRAGIACWNGDGFAPSKQLRYLLEETRAYRRYFAEAKAEAVLRL